jgi:hypothetical protein
VRPATKQSSGEGIGWTYIASGVVNEMGLEQLECFFGLALSTLAWSTRSSISCPKKPPVIEITRVTEPLPFDMGCDDLLGWGGSER